MGLLENRELEDKKFENNNTVTMSSTGVYEKQEFYGNLSAVWLGLRDIQGTDCYCDGGAGVAIKERIRPTGFSGTHFLDSGNYHYVNKIWLDRVEGELELLVFGHHTDTQMPIFGNILSCGGWIQVALDTGAGLKWIYLVGPSCIEAGANGKWIVGINEEELKVPGCVSRYMEDSGLPPYASLDEDILDRSCTVTNWDWGETQLEDVLACIKEAMSYRRIIGADVCGEEPEQEGIRASQINQNTNGEIICKSTEACGVLCLW